MNLNRHVTRTLYEDHVATTALLNRLESVLGRSGWKQPADVNDAETSQTLLAVAQAIETEIGAHFTFEEDHLFPRLEEIGEEALGELLTEEHKVALPVGRQIATMARNGLKNGFSDEEWREFFRLSQEFIERMTSHIQKEDIGLLPALEDCIEEEEDGELAAQYASMR